MRANSSWWPTINIKNISRLKTVTAKLPKCMQKYFAIGYVTWINFSSPIPTTRFTVPSASAPKRWLPFLFEKHALYAAKVRPFMFSTTVKFTAAQNIKDYFLLSNYTKNRKRALLHFTAGTHFGRSNEFTRCTNENNFSASPHTIQDTLCLPRLTVLRVLHVTNFTSTLLFQTRVVTFPC